MHTSIPLYRGSLGSYYTILSIEWYITHCPNYRPVQNGMDPNMVGTYLTRVGTERYESQFGKYIFD